MGPDTAQEEVWWKSQHVLRYGTGTKQWVQGSGGNCIGMESVWSQSAALNPTVSSTCLV
jgi:hypothetical protein